MSDHPIKVAVLGLGIMGGGMAGQLLAKGFEVTVWNRDPTKSAPLGNNGARIAASPGDAATGADFVVAMLANDDASRTVWMGEGGALAAMPPGAVAIECSTLTANWVHELGAAASDRGIGFLDAPVTGTKPQAASGALRFFAGGDEATIAKADIVLKAMGTEVIRVGPTGSGALLKLVNNFMCGVQVATLAEALVMLERSGLDMRKSADILIAGAPGSPLVKLLTERMLAEDYRPNFLPSLMAKDLSYAIEAFAAQGIDLATAAAARDRFERAAVQHPNSDMASVIESVRND